MAEREAVFEANAKAGAMLVAALTRGLEVALADAEKTLKTWGEEYKTRVQRVTPVETGLARQSWFMKFERTSEAMTITVYNTAKGEDGHESYVYYLEFGTDRIAGGRVKAWREGQPPVMSWPAKSGSLPVMPGFGTPAHARYQDIISKAFTPGTGEQMPMLRPIGYEITPQIIEDVEQAIREGFQSVINKRQGG